jgi:ribosomal protein S12 methylthiotransferase accessory factor
MIEVYFDGNKKVNALVDGFTVFTDQSVQAGGENSAPAPFTLFLASLATCAGIYVKSFCDQRGIMSGSITIGMDEVFDPVKKMIGKFIMKINVPSDFPVQYDEALIRTASLCAVKRHLHPDIENEITIVRR